jgi:hypothetical protein
MSTRVQLRRQPRRGGWTMADLPPLDPRDLEVVRAKAMLRAKSRPSAANLCGRQKA